MKPLFKILLAFSLLLSACCVKAQTNSLYGNPVILTSRTGDTTTIYLKTATKNINGIPWNAGNGKIEFRIPVDGAMISNDSLYYTNISGSKVFVGMVSAIALDSSHYQYSVDVKQDHPTCGDTSGSSYLVGANPPDSFWCGGPDSVFNPFHAHPNDIVKKIGSAYSFFDPITGDNAIVNNPLTSFWRFNGVVWTLTRRSLSDGGDSTGAVEDIGSLDNHAIWFITKGHPRIKIDKDGHIFYPLWKGVSNNNFKRIDSATGEEILDSFKTMKVVDCSLCSASYISNDTLYVHTSYTETDPVFISDSAAMLLPYLRKNVAAATYVPYTGANIPSGFTDSIVTTKNGNIGKVPYSDIVPSLDHVTSVGNISSRPVYIQSNNNANTVVTGLALQNSTAATSLVTQQFAPALELMGNYWDAGSGLNFKRNMRMIYQPGDAIHSYMAFQDSVSGFGWTNMFSYEGGTGITSNGFVSTGNIIVGNTLYTNNIANNELWIGTAYPDYSGGPSYQWIARVGNNNGVTMHPNGIWHTLEIRQQYGDNVAGDSTNNVDLYVSPSFKLGYSGVVHYLADIGTENTLQHFQKFTIDTSGNTHIHGNLTVDGTFSGSVSVPTLDQVINSGNSSTHQAKIATTETTLPGAFEVDDNRTYARGIISHSNGISGSGITSTYTFYGYANNDVNPVWVASGNPNTGGQGFAFADGSVSSGGGTGLLWKSSYGGVAYVPDISDARFLSPVYLFRDNGHLKLNLYGSGSITGTATYNLSVDASGNVIETAIGGSGGSSTFAGLTDVSLSSLATNDFIKYNGSSWINRTPSNVRSDLGLVIGTNVQAYDADLTTYAGITPSANVQTLLGSADYSAFRSSLGLGSSATHASSDYVLAANNLSDVTASTARTNLGLGTSATHASTDYLLVSNNLSDVTASTARTNLGANDVGSNLFTLSNPSAISFLRINADNTVTARSAANFKTDLSLNNVENTALSTWPGTSNVVTVGTITSGTWNGNALTSTYLPAATVYNNQANSFTAGMTQTVQADATHAGLSFGGVTADPSSIFTGNIWYRSDLNKFRYYDGTTTRSLVSEALAQTLTNKTIDASSNTISNIANTNIAAAAGIASSKLATVQVAQGGLNKTSIGTNKFPFSTDGSTYSEGTARQGAEETYSITGSISFTGTTAPSSTLTATYRWTQQLNVVTVRFFFTYVTSGTAITNVTFDLPADLPAPEIPSGFNSNNFVCAVGSGGMGATLNLDYAASRVALHQNSGSSTGFSVSITSGSTNTKSIEASITYFTASGF